MVWSVNLGTLLLTVLAPALVTAQFYGHYQQYGQNLGCTWGSKAVPLPGQCGAFQCVARWFLGSSYAAQCPYGTLFSVRAGRCVSPLAVAARCTGQSAQFWHYY